MTQADPEEIRAAVVRRYSALARAAQSGQQVTDCDPGEFAAGCFGSAGYGDVSEVPVGAARASLGCGNPVAVADLENTTFTASSRSARLTASASARRSSPFTAFMRSGRFSRIHATPFSTP